MCRDWTFEKSFIIFFELLLLYYEFVLPSHAFSLQSLTKIKKQGGNETQLNHADNNKKKYFKL